MKSKELIEILNTEPNADVRVQEQLDWSWNEIQSTGFGTDDDGKKIVLLRIYDLEASIALREREASRPKSDPITGNGINLADIHATALKALDALGLALSDHGHAWTPEQRALYDEATKLMQPQGEPAVIE